MAGIIFKLEIGAPWVKIYKIGYFFFGLFFQFFYKNRGRWLNYWADRSWSVLPSQEQAPFNRHVEFFGQNHL
jgi:hypothetical protein